MTTHKYGKKSKLTKKKKLPKKCNCKKSNYDITKNNTQNVKNSHCAKTQFVTKFDIGTNRIGKNNFVYKIKIKVTIQNCTTLKMWQT